MKAFFRGFQETESSRIGRLSERLAEWVWNAYDDVCRYSYCLSCSCIATAGTVSTRTILYRILHQVYCCAQNNFTLFHRIFPNRNKLITSAGARSTRRSTPTNTTGSIISRTYITSRTNLAKLPTTYTPTWAPISRDGRAEPHRPSARWTSTTNKPRTRETRW